MKYNLEQPFTVHLSAMFNYNPLLNVAKSTAHQFEAHVCEDGFAVATRKTCKYHVLNKCAHLTYCVVATISSGYIFFSLC